MLLNSPAFGKRSCANYCTFVSKERFKIIVVENRPFELADKRGRLFPGYFDEQNQVLFGS